MLIAFKYTKCTHKYGNRKTLYLRFLTGFSRFMASVNRKHNFGYKNKVRLRTWHFVHAAVVCSYAILLRFRNIQLTQSKWRDILNGFLFLSRELYNLNRVNQLYNSLVTSYPIPYSVHSWLEASSVASCQETDRLIAMDSP